jgi:hypothetical protein
MTGNPPNTRQFFWTKQAIAVRARSPLRPLPTGYSERPVEYSFERDQAGIDP